MHLVDVASAHTSENPPKAGKQTIMYDINIVLHEPEIPQNTGNISRTCAATHSSLHLIRPLGFSVDDRSLRRAGLDYWMYLDVHYYESLEDFFEKNPDAKERSYYFSTKAPRAYTEVTYPEKVFLFFGKETKGLPESLIESNLDRAVRIPMWEDLRSLNLSNSAAIAVYEVLRQRGFRDLKLAGKYGGNDQL